MDVVKSDCSDKHVGLDDTVWQTQYRRSWKLAEMLRMSENAWIATEWKREGAKEEEGQIFRNGTVHYAEGLWRMRRLGPVIGHCTEKRGGGERGRGRGRRRKRRRKKRRNRKTRKPCMCDGKVEDADWMWIEKFRFVPKTSHAAGRCLCR